jgi:uncharacterized protein YyaL (SSP411 family)
MPCGRGRKIGGGKWPTKSFGCGGRLESLQSPFPEAPEVAALMNRWFINIKADREERPDLDQIYQAAHHMLTQRSGGWPLTLFLSPGRTPYVGGTCFPKAARHNLPGMTDLLPRAAEFACARGRICWRLANLLSLIKIFRDQKQFPLR